MANLEQLAILRQGADTWNDWHRKNHTFNPRSIWVDLFQADLSHLNLSHAWLHSAFIERANLRGTNLQGAILLGANLAQADLSGANMREAQIGGTRFLSANLYRADLSRAEGGNTNFVGADLREANLTRAILTSSSLTLADCRKAILHKTDLRWANLSETDFRDAIIKECFVFGVATWGLNLKGAKQSDLVISDPAEAIITVDNLEVAQFIHLLLNNEKIRDVIDTVTSKVVLILGRFTPKRKVVLDAIKAEIRKYGYLPVMFDFDKPSSRDTIETASILAHMARFVIADITDAKSVLQELQRIVPSLPSVPVKPILSKVDYEPGMFDHIQQFRSVLDVYVYESIEELISSLDRSVVAPAQMAYEEIHGVKPQKMHET
jgi:uncharacterized protein YjbI with pentapeptide repeats